MKGLSSTNKVYYPNRNNKVSPPTVLAAYHYPLPLERRGSEACGSGEPLLKGKPFIRFHHRLVFEQSLRHHILATLLLGHRLNKERPEDTLGIHWWQRLVRWPSRAQTYIEEIGRGIIFRWRSPSANHLPQRIEVVARHIGMKHDEGGTKAIAHLAELTKGGIRLSLCHSLPLCARPPDVERVVVSNSPWNDLLPCPHRRRCL